MTPEGSIRKKKPDIQDVFRSAFHPAAVVSGQHADPNDIVLFVHIPKTAGVSLGESLQQGFDRFLGVDWTQPRESFRKLSREALYRHSVNPERQVIAGHFGWPELRFWAEHELPIKAISVIRDPFARFLSNFTYNSSEKHPANVQFREKFPTLRTYARSLATDFQITQLVGLTYSFDHALEKLVKHYTFLGVTEKLEASLDHLARSHGLEGMSSHRLNAAPAALEETADLVMARDIITEKSQNDLRLHRLVSSFY